MVLKCHLTFSVSSNGSLFSVWSDEDVPGAMAIWIPEPTKKIPPYLLKNNGGKTELARNLRDDKQKFYKAYTDFIKQTVKYDGTFVNFAETGGTSFKTVVNFLTEADEVVLAVDDHEYRVAEYAAVAVVNLENNIFAGVKTITKGDFLNKPERVGYSAVKL
uniref:Immune mapped protein 2 N-terminal domain-containing protein n=1 Tax=Aplanochytrium stocchinoi TaxID=215587 RepID=A0A7S3LQ98_9STRA|mmetsp:Transcript_10571/g.13248  ORF Transcript_10571/g.13248 Transcript_10571/m.13248 type:complete len:161 (+) Transcript_10571:86-568(+)|eukprot:CAMPEP_0204828972 /NCGR_PEP_ID=MMETSP1346-20131115/6948_1 /ASSEMBLY_ACC=CAM_ASM_000771 /TAXON_ID=215587 /ORGANISM="Aplanochytrium stocchinoi, Strain GSBS06" /LENGTH=160 /DNA_ID=CAMNT_0051958407 /DNA_START=214 /DNA_END=696 /DNA_ORIENTATION=-